MGRDLSEVDIRHYTSISIHAPRMGRDLFAAAAVGQVDFISIHAPRMGRDGHDKYQ